MLDMRHEWLALMMFVGVVILPTAYLYVAAVRERRRRQARHDREDVLRRYGA